MNSGAVVAIGIRRMTNAAEADACAAIMTSTEPWLTLGRSKDHALRMLLDPLRTVFVAIDNGVVQGFIVLVLQGSFVGYIQTIAVAERARGSGLGTRLMAYAEQEIFRVSPNVFMCVSDFNEGAQRLYSRLGYERVGELKDYVVRGHSEILLRKTRGPLAEFQAP